MMRPYSKKSLYPVLTENTTASKAQSSTIQSGATSQFEEPHQKRIFNHRHAHVIPDKLCRHFITQGKVAWQVKHVKDCRW
ncbi:hypothetical protein MRX96_012109 [Rhipicephalus microplus]